MRSSKFDFIAPLLLAIAFAGHLLNVLVLEPALGFSSPEDFYDADKLLTVIEHPVWKIGSIFHLMAAIAVLILAHGPTRERDAVLMPYMTAAGVAAAVMFVIVSVTNVVGLREFAVIADFSIGDRQAIYGAFFILRIVLLNTAVLLLGGFLLLGNVARLIMASADFRARYLGIAAGAACVVMPLVPAAAPAAILLIFGWSVLSGILALQR